MIDNFINALYDFRYKKIDFNNISIKNLIFILQTYCNYINETKCYDNEFIRDNYRRIQDFIAENATPEEIKTYMKNYEHLPLK